MYFLIFQRQLQLMAETLQDLVNHHLAEVTTLARISLAL